MERFKTPLIILALGVIPFWLFLGSSNTVRINGELVRDDHFNLIGVILAGIGLYMTAREIAGGQRSDLPRLGLIVLAGLVCLYQIVHSAGFL